MKPPGKFLRSGKVKDIYELDAQHLLFHFTNRVSAFDVVLPSIIPRKGEVLCKLSGYFFENLGVQHHMVRLEGPDSMVVRTLEMIPVECVVRGYLYGSLFDRVKSGQLTLDGKKTLAEELAEPYFDPTTKSDVKDEPITEDGIVREGRMSSAELKEVKRKTISIYKRISEIAASAGFIFADLKLEFGREKNGEILLADSIGPDEFRLWPKDQYKIGQTQESYDKQPVRDWLTSVGYKDKLDSARKKGLAIPAPPDLPANLVEETSRRYVEAYERLSRTKLT